MFDEHGPAIGTIHLPALDESLVAGRGLGAYSGERKAAVSSIESISESCISSSSFEQPWWPKEALLNITSSGAKYGRGVMARVFSCRNGRIEAMIDPSLHIYDVAAMLTIIPECGGSISTWSGETELEDKRVGLEPMGLSIKMFYQNNLNLMKMGSHQM